MDEEGAETARAGVRARDWRIGIVRDIGCVARLATVMEAFRLGRGPGQGEDFDRAH